jgi:hypothetical protein
MKKEIENICRQAQPFYFDYLTGQNSPESVKAFEHIGQCSHCRDEVKRLEQEVGEKSDSCGETPDMLALHHRCLSEWIDCDVVKPFLASQADPQLSIAAQTPITAHLAHCQSCRHDLKTIVSLGLSGQQLVAAAHLLADEPCEPDGLTPQTLAAIEAIRDRKASGIITRLQADDQGQPRFQVRHARQTPLTRRHLLVRFTAAAGILLVASLVIMMTTVAGGISIQEVYSAIHAIENCKIEIRDAEDALAAQKIFISRPFNLVVSQRNNETVILDLRNKRIHKSTPETGVVSEPSDSKLASIINRPDFGLLPFDSITNIPSHYQWKQLDNLPQNKDYEIYELSWTENATVVGPIEMTWRGYLLAGSHLPVRIEWLEKRVGRPQEVITETTIQYPDTPSMLKELQANPLYHLLEGDQIK